MKAKNNGLKKKNTREINVEGIREKEDTYKRDGKRGRERYIFGERLRKENQKCSTENLVGHMFFYR